MTPSDEEIDALVERLRNIGPYPMQTALRAADMLLALKARVEAAEKRAKELEQWGRLHENDF